MKHPSSALLRRCILDEADADERLVVERHLGACSRCRAKLAREALLDEWLVESCPVPDQPHGARSAFDTLWAQVDGEAAERAAAGLADAASRSGSAPVSSTVPGMTVPGMTVPGTAMPGVNATGMAGADMNAAGMLMPGMADVGGADADGRASTAQRIAPRRPRRVAALLIPLAIAAGIALVLWTRDGNPLHRDSPLEPQHAGPIAGAGPEQSAPDDELDEHFDATRLQVVLDALGDSLCEASVAHPTDDAAFAAASRDVCDPLRAQAWPVPMLLRRLARDGDTEPAGAALRLAGHSMDCDATLADALTDASRRDSVLAQLVAAPARPTASGYSSSLIAALANLAGTTLPDAATPLRIQAAGQLARDGQPAARAALGRVLDAALRDAAARPDAAPTLTALAAVAPAELVTEVLLDGGTRAATRAAAESCFADVAAVDRVGFGCAMDALLPRLPLTRRHLAARWAAAVVLPEALPGLCAALALEPDDAELAAAITSLGGDVAARGLAVALLAERGRPSAERLQASLVSCLVRAAQDERVAPAVAEVLAASRSEELLRIARALPEARRGVLLLAGLDALPASSAYQFRREALLTALACEGNAEDGLRLTAWIATRPATDRILALAWTTAYRLSDAEAVAAWREQGHDPDLLVNAASDCGTWPLEAPAPPARRQRVLDDTLRRAGCSSPPIASVSRGAF